MPIQVKYPLTDAERELIYRLRYEVYVEELGYREKYADPEIRKIVEPMDETGFLFGAFKDGKAVSAR